MVGEVLHVQLASHGGLQHLVPVIGWVKQRSCNLYAAMCAVVVWHLYSTDMVSVQWWCGICTVVWYLCVTFECI